MSWAARNKTSWVFFVKPSFLTFWRAVSSRTHSASIQVLNSLERSASAASARATGSSPSSAAAIALRSLWGGVINSWSANVATETVSSVRRDITNHAPEASHQCLGFFQQRLLAQHFRFAALAPFGTDIVGVDVAPAIRPEESIGFYERPWIGDDVKDALVQRLGGDRLG